MKTLTNRLSGLVLIGALMVAMFSFKPASAAFADMGSGTATLRHLFATILHTHSDLLSVFIRTII